MEADISKNCWKELEISGLAKIISCMSSIEQVDTHLDRNYKRDNVVCNQLIKMKLENLISNTGEDYDYRFIEKNREF